MLLNKAWIFYPLDKPENRIEVDLPYDAMLRESRDIANPGGDKIGFFKGGDYAYEKTLDIEKGDSSFYLEFEGVYHRPEVFVNDVKVYETEYGYKGFIIDITPSLRNGENKIKVIAHNADQPNSRWYTGSGIYRNVHLYVLQKTHIVPSSFKVNTLDYLAGLIEIKAKLSNETKAILEIADKEGRKVYEKTYSSKEIKDEITLDNPSLWDIDNPYLYKATLRIEGQEESLRFGVRGVALDKEKGLLINGKKTVLYGACIHSDNGLLGAESYREVEYRKVKLLKDLGYNAVRSAHNPICKDFLDACDELGLYVMDEYVDCWYIHKTKFGYSLYMEGNYEDDLTAMVEKDYSHPSVIFYSTGNEVSETSEPRGIELQKKMNELLHSLDKTRLTTCGINVFFNGIAHTPIATYSNKKSEKEYNSKPKVEGSSDIFNTLGNMLGASFMKNGARLPIVDKNTRGAFANMDVAGYNYGILRYKKDLRKYPSRFIMGTETFVFDAALFYELSKNNPRIIGDFVWTGLDYLGESGFAAELNKKDFPFLSDRSGWLTDDGGRKDILGNNTSEGDYTEVALRKKVIDIGVTSPYDYRIGTGKAAWRFNHAIRSYTFPKEEGRVCEFFVYSYAPYIEFYQNGKLLKKGKIDPKKCYLRFKGKYKPGQIKAIAKDDNGNILGEAGLQTADKEIALTYYKEDYPHQDRFAFIHFSFEDQEGNFNPHFEQTLEITKVEGGKLLRFGNAASYNKESYLSNKTKTYRSKAMAIFEFEEGKNEISFTVITPKEERVITLFKGDHR